MVDSLSSSSIVLSSMSHISFFLVDDELDGLMMKYGTRGEARDVQTLKQI